METPCSPLHMMCQHHTRESVRGIPGAGTSDRHRRSATTDGPRAAEESTTPRESTAAERRGARPTTATTNGGMAPPVTGRLICLSLRRRERPVRMRIVDGWLHRPYLRRFGISRRDKIRGDRYNGHPLSSMACRSRFGRSTLLCNSGE